MFVFDLCVVVVCNDFVLVFVFGPLSVCVFIACCVMMLLFCLICVFCVCF